MATTHGNSGAVYSGANAIAEVTGWSYSSTTDFADDTAIGDTARSYLASGIVDGSGSVNCHWDTTDTTGQETLTEGASVTLHIYPGGNTSGLTEYTGTVQIESIERAGEIGGVVSAAFTFKGVLTAATVA